MEKGEVTDNNKEIILATIEERKPQSLEQLTQMLRESYGLAEAEVVNCVMKLQTEGAIRLGTKPLRSISFTGYLRTRYAFWYWLTIAAGVLTALILLTVSGNGYPWTYLRSCLSLLFILFLPGFAFVKALLRIDDYSTAPAGGFATIQRATLSVALSVVIVSVVGLLFHYSTWGMSLTPIVLSLLAFTLAFATAAVIREWLYLRK